ATDRTRSVCPESRTSSCGATAGGAPDSRTSEYRRESIGRSPAETRWYDDSQNRMMTERQDGPHRQPVEGNMRNVLCLVALCLGAAPVSAHYNMLHPAAASGKKDEPVPATYQWGHPFEHQLFEAPKPEVLLVFTPDGKSENLTKTLEKVALPAGEGKTVTGYRFTFTPEQRGDYTFVLRTPPIFLEEDAEF